jgi:hypothetical protein
MDASVISALAALLGAGIGGLTSVLASWLNQHTQARAQWLAQDKTRRQELYKDFIEEASRSHVDSLQNDKPDLPALIGLYAKVSRMRIISSPNVVDSADQIVRAIVDTYLAPNKTFPELHDMLNSGSIDLLAQIQRGLPRGIRIAAGSGTLTRGPGVPARQLRVERLRASRTTSSAGRR